MGIETAEYMVELCPTAMYGQSQIVRSKSNYSASEVQIEGRRYHLIKPLNLPEGVSEEQSSFILGQLEKLAEVTKEEKLIRLTLKLDKVSKIE